MIPYRIDFTALREEIKNRGFKKILIQLPEGMKIYAIEIVNKLHDFTVYISSNPCYGACDIETYPDMLTIQFGHAEIPNIKYPDNIMFVEAFTDVSFKKVAEKFSRKINCKKIGLVASVQYVRKIDEVKKYLKKSGYEVFVGVGDGRIKHRGQVLGCNFSTAKNISKIVDCFAFLGTGKFHPVGVRITTDKPVYILNPHSNTVESVEEEADRFIRQRFGAIIKAEEANKFGIIVGTKIGQQREKLALALKKMIESAGKQAYMFYANNINPEDFYYDVDVFVNTSCPRITYDDYLRFPKPIISPVELEIALKLKTWNQFRFDEIVEVDRDKY